MAMAMMVNGEAKTYRMQRRKEKNPIFILFHIIWQCVTEVKKNKYYWNKDTVNFERSSVVLF